MFTLAIGSLPPVVIKEPESGKFQLLLEVQGKGKEKVSHDESSLLYAKLGLTNSETESDEDKPGTGSNPGDAAVSQPQLSHVVHAGPNLEHMDVEVTDSSIQQNLERMDEEFTTTAYPNVQENLKLPTKDQVRLEEPCKLRWTCLSMDNGPIHQEPLWFYIDHSGFDLTISQPVSTTVQAPLPTSTATVTAITTTTSLLHTTQPQQGSSDSILIQGLDELIKQIYADLLQDNLALEERLDKHGSRLYKLENLDIPYQVSKAVDEIVMDAVDWAIQAPLRDRLRDLPEADMK
ncbi:hypothetical protein Tco_1313346 [Tanacetum coccineum]